MDRLRYSAEPSVVVVVEKPFTGGFFAVLVRGVVIDFKFVFAVATDDPSFGPYFDFHIAS